MPHSSAPVVRTGGNVTATGTSGNAPSGGLTPEQIMLLLTTLRGAGGGGENRPGEFGRAGGVNVSQTGANPFQGLLDLIGGGGGTTRPTAVSPGNIPTQRPQAPTQLTNPPGLSALRTPDVDAGVSATLQDWLRSIAQGARLLSGPTGFFSGLIGASRQAERETAATQASREPGAGARRGQGARAGAAEAIGRTGRDLSRGFEGFVGRGR